AFVGCVDCLVAHNAVVGTTRWLVRILQETVSQSGYTFEPARDGRVINNSFVWRDAALSTHVNVGPNTEPTTFSFSHNLWYAMDAPNESTPMLPVSEDGSVIGQGSVYESVTSALEFSQMEVCDGPERGAAVPLPEVDG